MSIKRLLTSVMAGAMTLMMALPAQAATSVLV